MKIKLNQNVYIFVIEKKISIENEFWWKLLKCIEIIAVLNTTNHSHWMLKWRAWDAEVDRKVQATIIQQKIQ